VVPADLRDLDAVAGLVDAATDRFGRLDIVVNNVGGTVPCALMDTTAEYLEEAFHFNVSTAHALLRAAAPHLVAGLDGLDHRNGLDHRTGLDHGTGAVVNISSVLGRVPGRGYLAYGTAKAALAHYTRLAARDLSPRVRVNAIAVGSVLTSALEFVASDEGTRQAMEQATPLGRIGEPDEVAATALYLCSPAGGYLTGKVLEVDGGLDQPNLDLGLPDLGPEAT
jgi:7-alpha-hydroxysteroid dehydrogenase